MGNEQLGRVLHHVRKLAAARQTDPLSDRELLERFVADQDEAAFAELVKRHSSMVLNLCRRVLRHAHDAEDAWQVTFLVLARNAVSIRKKDSVASWLHGVAQRVAANLHRDVARRGAREGPAVDVPQADTTEAVAWRDVRVALDGELARSWAGAWARCEADWSAAATFCGPG
jgi:DNA-directed RNA polymerase specialized sigma24 family protein